MSGVLKDRYVLFSLASIAMIIFVCALGPLGSDGTDGNVNEITGVISDPVRSQNGTVFNVTDLEGNEFRCFYRAGMPETPALCRLSGSFSEDGSMFFVDRITVNDVR